MADTVSHNIDSREVPIQRVTVFNDRAELKRTFAVELKEGKNEVYIQHLSSQVLDDTVRVNGHGNAIIHEVQVKDKYVSEHDKGSQKVRDLRASVDEAKHTLAELQDKVKIAQKKQEALDKLITKIGSGENKVFPSNDESFESVEKLFGFYDRQSIELKNTERSLEKEVEKAQENFNNLFNELNQYLHPGPVKTVTVVLESATGGEVELEIRYQVVGAYWRPSYDVRVEQKEDVKSMQIIYAGRVTQNSGEEWSGCDLVLSTAKPSVGGSIPELGTLDVQFYKEPEQPQIQAYGMPMMACNARGGGAIMKSARMYDSAPPPEMLNSTALVNEEALSSEFLIERPAAIPSDGSEHKVTIGVASLQPILSHECVPSKDNSVFLTASAVNSSDLPLLQGDAAIFLDGNFVTKSYLKAVSPGERFSVSLGVDSSVKIDYKPAHKLAGEVGLINKSATHANQQKIVVKNTKNVPVLITIKENIPRSLDEKIKVKIISPSPISHQEPQIGEPRREGAYITASNNIEWTTAVDAQDKKELVLKWAIEYPGTEKLDFQEKF